MIIDLSFAYNRVWVASIPDWFVEVSDSFPTFEEAIRAVKVIALRIVAQRFEAGEYEEHELDMIEFRVHVA